MEFDCIGFRLLPFYLLCRRKCMQERECIMFVRCDLKTTSLGQTVLPRDAKQNCSIHITHALNMSQVGTHFVN